MRRREAKVPVGKPIEKSISTGASGPIDLDEAGDATAGVYDLYEFTDGVPEPTDEIEVCELFDRKP